MDSMLIIPPLFGMAGLLVALFIYFVVLKYDGGTDKVKKTQHIFLSRLQLELMLSAEMNYTHPKTSKCIRRYSKVNRL